jgi:hypothetical protein
MELIIARYEKPRNERHDILIRFERGSVRLVLNHNEGSCSLFAHVFRIQVTGWTGVASQAFVEVDSVNFIRSE